MPLADFMGFKVAVQIEMMRGWTREGEPHWLFEATKELKDLLGAIRRAACNQK